MNEFKIAPSFTDDDIHCVVDLETLGLNPEAMILQIGAVLFKRTEILAVFQQEINPLRQPGRTEDPDTLAWWNKQDPEVREQMFSGELSLEDVLERFLHWTNEIAGVPLKDIKFWGKGPDFDLVILQHALHHNHSLPEELNFRNFHSVRTAEAIISRQGKVAIANRCLRCNYKPHTAIGDAMYETALIQHMLWLTAAE